MITEDSDISYHESGLSNRYNNGRLGRPQLSVDEENGYTSIQSVQKMRVERALNRSSSNLTHLNRYTALKERNDKYRNYKLRRRGRSIESNGHQYKSPLNSHWGEAFSYDFLSIDKSMLKRKAFEGELAHCPFRSICWRLFLNLITTDTRKWPTEVKMHRVLYEKYLRKIADMRLNASEAEKKSLLEVETIIRQDVERTYPEVDYFRLPDVKETMQRILMCHAINEECSYRQGMHEILAVILYVMQMDDKNFKRAKDYFQLDEEVIYNLEIFYNAEHQEADAYSIFKSIMDSIQGWYLTVKPVEDDRSYEVVKPGHEDSTCFCPGVRYIESIHENELSKISPQLFQHLNDLQLAPTIFGLRWIRLIFAHEFEIPDLLCLWDSVFAAEHSKGFSFIKYIFVALLIHLEEFLLEMDFSDALCTLMRIPKGIDVSCLIKYALHYSNPSVFRLPIGPHNCKNQLKTQALLPTANHCEQFPQRKGNLKRTDSSVESLNILYEKCRKYITDSFIDKTEPERPLSNVGKEPKQSLLSLPFNIDKRLNLPNLDSLSLSPSIRRKYSKTEEDRQKAQHSLCNKSLDNVKVVTQNVKAVLEAIEQTQSKSFISNGDESEPRENLLLVNDELSTAVSKMPDLSEEILCLQHSLTRLHDLENDIKLLQRMEQETNF